MLDVADDGTVWHIGHIIPHDDQGPDIYENLRPICFDCNQEDKNHRTSYHHMVAIGTMLSEDLEPALARIEAMAEWYREDRRRKKCHEMLQASPGNRGRRIAAKPCSNNKLPRHNVCGVHSKIKMKPSESEVYLAETIGSMMERYDPDIFEPEEQECIEDILGSLLRMRYAIAERRNNPVSKPKKTPSKAKKSSKVDKESGSSAVQPKSKAPELDSIVVKRCEDTEDETEILNRYLFNLTFEDESPVPDKSWMNQKGLVDINNSNLEEVDWTANLASLADQARVDSSKKRSKNRSVRKRDVSEDP